MITELHPPIRSGDGSSAVPASLFRIVYTSSAVYAWRDTELFTLLAKSRHNNERAGISGLLLYRDGNIMQLLEGPEAAVTRTFARIRNDPRHTGIITLLREQTAARTFADSSMGFRNLNDPRLRELAGYSEFLNEDWGGLPPEVTANRALRLLQVFRQAMR